MSLDESFPKDSAIDKRYYSNNDEDDNVQLEQDVSGNIAGD